MGDYYNFHQYEAQDWLARRAFLARWWRVNSRDRRWRPPDHRAYYNAIVRRSEPAIERFSPVFVTMDAMLRQSTADGYSRLSIPAIADEQCVGIVIPLLDERGPAAVTHLAMLALANDSEVAERIIGAAIALQPGALLAGPTSLTPRLARGVLVDHFHQDPPINSPYNPPYLAEVLDGVLEPVQHERMWFLDCAQAAASLTRTDAPQVRPFDVALLAHELLPLLLASWDAAAGEPPDGPEVDLALRLWRSTPLLGWCVLDGEEIVGYIVAQADAGRYMRRVQGGRTLRGRAWMAIHQPGQVAQQGVTQGRILLGGVLPKARRMGAATALLRAVAEQGRIWGWNTLAIGPIAEESETVAFLEACSAVPRQHYVQFASSDDIRQADEAGGFDLGLDW